MLSHEKERWLEVLFGRALELPNSEREAFARKHCSSDPDVAEALLTLLREDRQPTSPLLQRNWSNSLGRIGNYVLLKKLGEGGMGTVYLAKQEEPVERLVALKTIKAGLESEGAIARFEGERQTLALMNHPAIASIFDGGVDEGGRPYLVMEYVPGIPFIEFCDRFRLGIPERLQLFNEVCEAVQHAHHKGIVHRDLKPANILVSWQGDRRVPKIIDFGIAWVVGAPHAAEESMGFVVGSPLYLSPEQLDSRGIDPDARVDIYALGVTLYELLCGERPYGTAELKELGPAEILRTRTPLPPSRRLTSSPQVELHAAQRDAQPAELARKLRGDLDWIVGKAMEKERNLRYDSPHAVREDVLRYQRNEPVAAAPPSRAYLVHKFIGRHRWAVAAGIALFASLTAAVIGTTTGMLRATKARAAEERARQEAQGEAAHLRGTAEVFDFLLLDAHGDGSGESPTLESLLATTRSRLGKRLADRPVEEASAHFELGRALLLLGDEKAANEELLAAYEIQLRVLDPTDERLFRTLGVLIHATRWVDGLKSAEGYVQHSLAFAAEHIRRRHPSLVPPLEDVLALARGPRPEQADVQAKLQALQSAVDQASIDDYDTLIVARVLVEVGLVLHQNWGLVEGLIQLRSFGDVVAGAQTSSLYLESLIVQWVRAQLHLMPGSEDFTAGLEEARALTKRVDELPRDHWLRLDIRRLEGLALAGLGQPAEAEAELQSILADVDAFQRPLIFRHRQARAGLVEMCKLLEGQGKLEAFLQESFGRWCKIPEPRDVWWAVALPENSTQTYAVALRLLLERPDDSSTFQTTLGIAHFRAGELEEAVGTLRANSDRKGMDATLAIFLALAHRGLGQHGEERSALAALEALGALQGRGRAWAEELTGSN